jgi:hypothetical protein
VADVADVTGATDGRITLRQFWRDPPREGPLPRVHARPPVPSRTGTVTAAVDVLLFHLAFGLGETMLHPTIPATVNDLAPDHLRGRYNASNSLAFHLGSR